jgi:ABC-2 type transport system permease protein/sodium transport system permease protein
VPRLGLLFAKYVTVLTVAVLTALVNLTAMTVTLQVSGLGAQLFRGVGLSPLLVLEIFALLLLFAAFFSAVLLTLTSFARSFKEAQAYLIPLMLLSLAPGVMGLLPGLKLTGPVAVTPLLNIVLLARDLFEGSVDPALAGVVVLTTLLYAAAAIALAARIFGAEAVLYSEQSGWSDLFRRPEEPRPVPTVGSALMCLALMFPTSFVLNGVIAQLDTTQVSLGERLVLLGLVSVLLFATFPLIGAYLSRVRVRSGFLLRGAAWPAYLGALLLGLSLWPFVLEIIAALTDPQTAQNEQVRQALAWVRQSLPVAVVVALFVVPAVVEELFFRGYLFSALRARSGPLTAVVVSALLFGLFHLVATDAFSFARFVPSTLLGLVLGWVCWKTGSVVPGMLLHACHNGLMVLLTYEQTVLVVEAGQVSLPPLWLLGAALGAGVGAALIQVRGDRT